MISPPRNRHPQNPRDRIVVALDVGDWEEFRNLLKALRDKIGMVKIGKQLFTSCGPKAVEQARSEGFEVFLDLKFHDIPNTVAAAVKAASMLSVALLTVHAQGGKAMLQAAAQAAKEAENPPAILAVTVLTSLGESDLQELGYSGKPLDVVKHLAGLSLQAGVDGLVTSSLEVLQLRKLFGQQPLLVTPGIRPAGSSIGDQVRVATAARAVADGADFLVIGRPITHAKDPQKAVDDLIQELTDPNS